MLLQDIKRPFAAERSKVLDVVHPTAKLQL